MGAFIMINPTLIRGGGGEKNPPASFFCLFAAAGLTGQRAQAPPAWKTHGRSVYVDFIFSKANPLKDGVLLARSPSAARDTKGAPV